MSMCQCACCGQPASRRFRPFALLFNVLLAYVLLVVGGGTLINSGHPVAVEAGRLLHVVTFVEPAITWTHAHGMQHVANGLQFLANGIPIGGA